MPSRSAGRFFFCLPMKNIKHLPFLIAAVALIALCSGCASNDDYVDDAEYSNMPWNTPQQWEGSRSVPGLGGSGGQGY